MTPAAPFQTARGRLSRCAGLLVARLDALEGRLAEGDDAWPAYCDTVRALAAVVEQSAPGAGGELLTTREMAERLGIAPKTLLKHTAKGKARPAIRSGKLIRWRGSEVVR